MSSTPKLVAAFLQAKRIAVAGVSRSGNAPANAILRRLAETGHDVVAVNPNASEVEGRRCYPSIAAIEGPVDAAMIVTHPSVSAQVARECLDRGIESIWFHRSFGAGSVAPDALQVCRDRGVEPIEGGCPLMYCQPVDPAHAVFRWWLRLRHRVPE